MKDDGDRWKVRWREYYIDPRGVERSKYKQEIWSKQRYPNKRQAQRALEEKLRPLNAEDYRPITEITLKVFAEKWKTTVLTNTKDSNDASSKSHLRVHLIPDFGDWLLTDITTEVLQGWIAAKMAEGKHEAKTIRNIMDTMRSLMTKARKWGYIRHKPFEDLELPPKGKPNTYAFTLDETIAIINEASEPWKTLVRIVAESGVRSGEVAGLRIEDFDPIGLTLTVNQSVWNTKIQTPKSPNAVRREPISPQLAEAIQRHIEAWKVAKDQKGNLIPNPFGLIFTGQTGQPLQMIHFINRQFRPILTKLGFWGTPEKPGKLDKLGIRSCGLHALRRMNGTQMDDQNVPMATRQARLGHAHPSTTLYHYTRPIDSNSRKFADRMGVMLAPVEDDCANLVADHEPLSIAQALRDTATIASDKLDDNAALELETLRSMVRELQVMTEDLRGALAKAKDESRPTG